MRGHALFQSMNVSPATKRSLAALTGGVLSAVGLVGMATPAHAHSAVPRTTLVREGNALCCLQVEDAGDLTSPLQHLLGLLGVKVADLNGMVGVTCTPTSLVGGGAGCHAQLGTCSSDLGGLVALGCSDIVPLSAVSSRGSTTRA